VLDDDPFIGGGDQGGNPQAEGLGVRRGPIWEGQPPAAEAPQRPRRKSGWRFTPRKMPGGSAIGSCVRRVSNDNALPDRPRTEESGAVSAYVPGLPVYAAANSHAKAERAIRAVLAEYLNAHPASRPGARVRVARVSDRGKTRVSVAGVAALVGAKRSDAKARASRANGRLGGRPPKHATTRATGTKTSR
jgi:hypothetical protein